MQALVLYLVYKLKIQVPVPVMEDLIIQRVEELEWEAVGMGMDAFIAWFEEHFVVYGVAGGTATAKHTRLHIRRPSV